MPSSFTDPNDEFLAQLFLRMVERLRILGGPSWQRLVRFTMGRTGVIDLDGHGLKLSAQDRQPYEILVEPAAPMDEPNFRGAASVIIDMLRGRTTLDKALAEGRIFVRAPLSDLLGMYLLVTNILADSPLDAQLRMLCVEFETAWPHFTKTHEAPVLSQQNTTFGVLVQKIRPEHWMNGQNSEP